MQVKLPGFGTTVSKIPKCFVSHPVHNVLGTSQRKTFPSRKIHAEGIISPSRRWIPSLVIDLTWTGGGLSSARIFVNELSRRVELACILRDSSGKTGGLFRIVHNEGVVRKGWRAARCRMRERDICTRSGRDSGSDTPISKLRVISPAQNSSNVLLTHQDCLISLAISTYLQH